MAHPKKSDPDFDPIGESIEDFMSRGMSGAKMAAEIPRLLERLQGPPDLFESVRAKMKPPEPKGGPSKETDPKLETDWFDADVGRLPKDLPSSKKES